MYTTLRQRVARCGAGGRLPGGGEAVGDQGGQGEVSVGRFRVQEVEDELGAGGVGVGEVDAAAGVAELRKALKGLYREQFHMVIPAAARALADGLSRGGRQDEASAIIQSGISSAERMGQRFWMPELLRE